jgi:Ca2+-binding RTX toxin-like protein
VRRGLALLGVVALAGAGPSAGGESTHAAAGLVFVQASPVRVRSAPDSLELCAAATPGTQAALVTPGGSDQQPAVSRTGEVAFVRGLFGSNRLMRVPPAGGAAVAVRSDVIAFWPSWTPDGARIVFATTGTGSLTGNLDLYSVASDGSDLRRLTTDPLRDTMAAVSPDGTRIAFVRGTSDLGGGELFVAGVDGTAERRAAPLSGVTRPTWSPDGRELVFAAGGSLWRVVVDSDAAAVPLTAGADPAYSPDGTHIAFVRDRDVWIMRRDGQEQVNVTHSPIGEGEPAWLRAGAPAASEPCAIVGTEGRDTLVGTEGDDEFYDIAGDDVIDGRGGNDYVLDGPGDDEILGGPGDDEIVLVQGANRAAGGEGNDLLTAQRLSAAQEPNLLSGDAGDDSLYGGLADDRLVGGAGNDTIFGGRGRDTVDAGPGNDRVEGNAGDDVVDGGPGNDMLFGGVRYTGPGGILNGNDLLIGGAGVDFLAGGPGRDDLRGGTGADYLLGGAGADRLRGDAGFDVLAGDAGDDLLLARDREPDELRGGLGHDLARVDRGVDLLFGLERLLP